MRILLLTLTMLFSGCTLLKHWSNDNTPIQGIALFVYNEEYAPLNTNIETINGGVNRLKSILVKKSFAKESDVIIKKNVTYKELQNALIELEDRIDNPKYTNIFIYFSGHGVMNKNLSKSYIEMTDKNKHTVANINIFYDQIKKMRVNATIMVVDACRNSKSLTNSYIVDGQSRKIPKNTRIYYSTRNTETSPFTIPNREETFFLKAMIKNLNKNVEVTEAFRLVGVDVKQATGEHEEVIKYEGTLNKKVFFYKKILPGPPTSG